jgi:hypothetical protein
VTDAERVARIIARASLVKRAELAGIDLENADPARAKKALVVLDCAVEFLWVDHIGTANEVIAALGGDAP